ncbi:MAG: DUF2188 domain-containing protein [Acholeplasmataceae bacterium]|jgi:hypothetical protein|nr:DUF2188 domain-containing protein [Acholeplasmataceae bacterium]
MCFFRKRREKKQAMEATKAEMSQKETQSANVVKPKEEAPQKPVTPVEEKPVVKEEAKVEPKKDTTKPAKIAKYHVSQNKDEGTENFKKWRVRKEGSTKTIKFFDTQKEAIDYASQLAESQGSSVVIHKVDGSIRKQDYAKKE